MTSQSLPLALGTIGWPRVVLSIALGRALLRATATIWFLIAPGTYLAAEPLLPDLIAWANQSTNPFTCYMYCGSLNTSLIRNKVVYQFRGALPNIGDGPLEVREVTHPDAIQDVYQRIYQSEGGLTESLIGSFPNAASIPPRHLWLPGIAQYKLRTVLPGNGVGPVVAFNDKTSMAVVDSDDYNKSLPGAPQNSVYNNVSAPILGISIGWADVYGTNLPGQWVEATGLPDGQYWLEVTVDPYDRIQETDETNNTTRILVNLTIPAPLIHPGDYNDDGVVDAADYTVWRNTLGQTVTPLGTGADGDGNGIIGPPDYGVWKAHFGESAAGGGAVAPEPAGIMLALVAVGILLWFGRRRESTTA